MSTTDVFMISVAVFMGKAVFLAGNSWFEMKPCKMESKSNLPNETLISQRTNDVFITLTAMHSQ